MHKADELTELPPPEPSDELANLSEEIASAASAVASLPPSDPPPGPDERDLLYRLGATEGQIQNLQASQMRIEGLLQSLATQAAQVQQVEQQRLETEEELAEEVAELQEEIANPPSLWERLMGGRNR